MNELKKAVQAFQKNAHDKALHLASNINESHQNYGQAMQLSGVIKFKDGDYAKAKYFLQIANKYHPDNTEILNALAACEIQLTNYASAENILVLILKTNPDYFDALKNLALLKEKQANNFEAFELYLKLIQLKPSDLSLMNSLSAVTCDKNQTEIVEHLFKQYLRANPNNHQLNLQYAQFLVNSERYTAALEQLALLPTIGIKNNNITALQAFCLKELGRFNEAKTIYLQLINTIENTENDTQSVELLSKLKNNLAILELTLGNYQSGWELYRHRPSLLNNTLEVFQGKLPTDLSNQKILLIRDQGIGDELFFLRYAPWLKQRGADVTYYSSEKLAPLLKLSNDLPRLVTRIDDISQYHYVISVADLPYVLNLNHPVQPFYLNPVVNELAQFKNTHDLTNPDIQRIGITWRAGLQSINKIATTLSKCIPLNLLIDKLKDFQGEVYILQRSARKEEINLLKSALSVPVYDFSELNNDLVSMAYMLESLDEYIGVSNTNMHIRGSLNKNATVLVPYPAEWRWGVDSLHSEWYKGFDIIRQNCDSAWNWT